MTLNPITYAIMAAFVALGLTLGAVSVQDWSRGKDLQAVRADNTALQLRIDAAAMANETNQKTITELRDANAANTASQAAAKLSAEAAFAQLGAMRDQLDAARAASQKRSEAIYANDADCAAWGDRPVCPALAASMRERAAVQAGNTH